jgi:hypothetical protein
MVLVRGAVAVLLTFLISRAVSQENEVECLTACGSDGSILGVVNSVTECCVNMAGGAFNIPGAGLAIDCALCSDYQNIAGDIGFSFTPSNLMINDTLLAECIVVTQAGLSNPRADITWLGPDGTVFSSLQDVGFSEVTTAGIRQQEARLSLTFPRFSAADFGEYACIAAITSDSVPGAQTSVFRSVQIPSAPGDIFQRPVPIYPIGEDSRPLAGQMYFLDCIVNRPSLTNDDIFWVAPDNTIISDTSDRVSVGDVFQGQNGRSVRRLTFNPLRTDDSGSYTCVSPDGTALQTLTVDVPSPDTRLTTTPTNPISGESLQIDCSSAVPPELQGQVNVTLFGPDGTRLAEASGATRADAVFQIARASTANSGEYICNGTITSQFLVSEGRSRPLVGSTSLQVTVLPAAVNECQDDATNNCDVNAVCIDLPESFVCTCQVGFTGSGTEGECEDINECVTGTDSCQQDETCVNTQGSFSCTPPATPSSPPSVPTSPSTTSAPTPSEEPSVVPPTDFEVTTPVANGPVSPPIPVLPLCNPPCHTNGECVANLFGMYACQCKEGFQGNGTLCCINNALIDLLRKQAQEDAVGMEEGAEDENEGEEDEATSTKKKSKKGKKKKGKKKKGKRRSIRRAKSHRSRTKSKGCTKSKKSCVEEAPSPVPPPGYNINIVSIPDECRPVLNELLELESPI